MRSLVAAFTLSACSCTDTFSSADAGLMDAAALDAVAEAAVSPDAFDGDGSGIAIDSGGDVGVCDPLSLAYSCTEADPILS
jgi:hypothetical protein